MVELREQRGVGIEEIVEGIVEGETVIFLANWRKNVV